MASSRSLLLLFAGISTAIATTCPFGHTSGDGIHNERRAVTPNTDDFLGPYTINTTNAYLTSDVGGPIEDQNSLSAGERGPTLLEDFIFRQKITHFDHERVWQNEDHWIWILALTVTAGT
jgi:catalase